MNGSRVVWKYPFTAGETRLALTLPRGSRVVAFAFQRDVPTAWIERPNGGGGDASELVELAIIGTGELIPDGWEHRGAALVHEGAYVFHLYERRPL